MKRRKGKDQYKGRRTREEVREGGGGERSRALTGEGGSCSGRGVSPDVEGVAEAVTPSSAVPQ